MLPPLLLLLLQAGILQGEVDSLMVMDQWQASLMRALAQLQLKCSPEARAAVAAKFDMDEGEEGLEQQGLVGPGDEDGDETVRSSFPGGDTASEQQLATGELGRSAQLVGAQEQIEQQALPGQYLQQQLQQEPRQQQQPQQQQRQDPPSRQQKQQQQQAAERVTQPTRPTKKRKKRAV
jgi:molecular chaperone DnaK